MLGLVALMVFFILCPLYMSEYRLWVLTIFCINVILVTSFRLMAITGNWCFAHVSFMGIGGYTTALLTTKYFHLSFWLSLPLGGLATALVALLISYPILRTRGFYFFMATFAAGVAIRQVWIRFIDIFGGHSGIGMIVPPSFAGISLADPVAYYYLVLAIVILSTLTIYLINRSRIGLIAKSIAMNESLCESAGINASRYLTLFFMISAFFAGIAGVLLVHYTGIANPGDFSNFYMFSVITWAIVGGLSSFAGPILGLSVMTAVAEVFRPFLAWVPLINGVFIVGIMLFLPNGLQSLPDLIRQRAHRHSPPGEGIQIIGQRIRKYFTHRRDS